MTAQKTPQLEALLDEWDIDSSFDVTDLAEESARSPRLHQKYLRKLVTERLRLRAIEAEGKALRRDKHEFYTQGDSPETRAKGWEMPARGVILQKDLPIYMDADKEMVAHNLRTAYQAEIVAAIELIMTALKGRNWELRLALDDIRFKSGQG